MNINDIISFEIEMSQKNIVRIKTVTGYIIFRFVLNVEVVHKSKIIES